MRTFLIVVFIVVAALVMPAVASDRDAAATKALDALGVVKTEELTAADSRNVSKTQVPDTSAAVTTNDSKLGGTQSVNLIVPPFAVVTTTAPASAEVISARNTTDAAKLKIEQQLADLYLKKATADAALPPLAYLQAERDFWFKVAVAILGTALLLFLTTRFQQGSFSVFGQSFSWSKLAPQPPPTPPSRLAARQKMAASRSGQALAEAVADKAIEVDAYSAASVQPDAIAVCHRVRNGVPGSRQVELFVTAFRTADLHKIERVEYHPHREISSPITSGDAATGFRIVVVVPAEFMLYAYVYFHNVPTPVTMKRYINLR